MHIAIVGTGYVGLSMVVLLAQHNRVTAVDIVPEKVEKINNRISPIQDEYIEKYLAEKNLDLTATLDGASAYRDADYVIIAAPTNYDPQKDYFDCSAVESVIGLVLENSDRAIMVIKSTIPVGFTEKMRKKYHTDRILSGIDTKGLLQAVDTAVEMIKSEPNGGAVPVPDYTDINVSATRWSKLFNLTSASSIRWCGEKKYENPRNWLKRLLRAESC